jgi:hypothetical protein
VSDGTEAGVASDASAEAAVRPDAGGGSCPAGAILCDDFEKYTAGTSDLGPDWTTYTYSGSVKVDTTKPHGGKQSLHLTTQSGSLRYADLIKETPGKQLLPLVHYGRAMVWVTAIPPDGHWNINQASGPMMGAPSEIAKYSYGGQYGKLMPNYTQRALVMRNGTLPVRGGGPENGDPNPEADCAIAAPTEKLAPGKWVCWEWEFDGKNDETHLWLDGQPMTEVDVVKSGKQCQGPGFMGRRMMPNYVWEGPEMFTKIIIGWEQYQSAPAEEVWLDDLVMSEARVGCPAP